MMMMMKCVLSHGDETSSDDMATLPGRAAAEDEEDEEDEDDALW